MILMYDVWVNDVHVGRFVQRWGEPAILHQRGVTCVLVVDETGRVVQLKERR